MQNIYEIGTFLNLGKFWKSIFKMAAKMAARSIFKLGYLIFRIQHAWIIKHMYVTNLYAKNPLDFPTCPNPTCLLAVCAKDNNKEKKLCYFMQYLCFVSKKPKVTKAPKIAKSSSWPHAYIAILGLHKDG